MPNYLITEAYLKSHTSISKQKDAQAIKTVFTTVEKFYIEELLGIPLYEHFQRHAEDETANPITEAETALLGKVQYYYALMAEWEILFDLFDMGNKGNTADDKAASIDLVKLKRGEILSKAEQLKASILRFLEDNKQDFANYFPATKTNIVRAEGAFPIVFDHSAKFYYGL